MFDRDCPKPTGQREHIFLLGGGLPWGHHRKREQI